MSRRPRFITPFLVCLFLSFFTYFLFRTSIGYAIGGLVEHMIHPLQSTLFSAYAATKDKDSPFQKLQEENLRLRSELTKLKVQEKEIAALRDQFAVTNPSSRDLSPARIIGLKGFLPGYTLPEQIIIDKGRQDGVKDDSVVIYKNTLIGRVSEARSHVALVDLTFKKDFSVTAATSQTDAIGVARGQGDGEVLLDNVVLSDNLKTGDTVVTKGSTKDDKTGAPPGLIIGKIVSVDKKPSALFQSAKVELLVDITRLSTVFVITGNSQ